MCSDSSSLLGRAGVGWRLTGQRPSGADPAQRSEKRAGERGKEEEHKGCLSSVKGSE